MMSATEIEFIKHGGQEVSVLVQSRESERTLKEKLSSIELEKAHSIRELEINKMKFLRSHHNLVPKTIIINRDSAKIELRKKIEYAKEDQRQCQVSLKQRKDAFIDALRKRPLSNISSTRNKQEARLEALRMEEEKINNIGHLPDYDLHSNDLASFQQSFQLANQRQRKHEQPFLNSVNVILETLKGNRSQPESGRKDSRQDKFDSLTRHILSAYAGISVETEATEVANDTENNIEGKESNIQKGKSSDEVKEEGKNKHPPAFHSSNASLIADVPGETLPVSTASTDLIVHARHSPGAEDDVSISDDLSDTRYGGPPNKALQMWAAVRREQHDARKRRIQNEKKRVKNSEVKTDGSATQVNQADLSIHVIPPLKTSRCLPPVYRRQSNGNSLPSIRNRSFQKMDSVNARDGSLSPKSPISPRSYKMLSVDNIHPEDNSLLRTRVHSWSSGQKGRPESLSLVSRRRSSVGSRPERELSRQTLPVPLETPDCSKTIVIVHDDSNLVIPRRRSIFSIENNETRKNSPTEREKKAQTTSATENNGSVGEVSAIEESDNIVDRLQTNCVDDGKKLGSDELNLHLETSSFSARSESTIASLINDKARSSVLGTRESGVGGRRMSVQTQGALRLWASVQRQEADVEDGPDWTAYRTALDNVVEAAAGVDEQVQVSRLEGTDS